MIAALGWDSNPVAERNHELALSLREKKRTNGFTDGKFPGKMIFMNGETTTPPPLDTAPAPVKEPSSTGKKVALGCGCGCLGLIIITVIGMAAGYFWVMGMVDEFKEEFIAMGMKEQPMAQMVTITEAPTEPTFYVGQVVKVQVDTDVEIGIIAQTVELHGVASEKIYFRGQIIQIMPDAHLKKGLDVKCQMVQGMGGQVDGGITGPAQVIQPPSLKNGSSP